MNGKILEGPRQTSPLPLKSLGVIFYNAIKSWDPSKIPIIDSDNEEVTYGNFFKLTVKIARKLEKLGVRKGDVITIVSHNQWKYLATVVAGFYVGAAVNLLNPDYTPGELKHLLAKCKPKIIFCVSKSLKYILPLQDEDYFPHNLVTYDDETPLATNFDSFLEDIDDETNFKPVELDPKKETALILTSSGTTGLPKAVELTHFNLRTTMTYAGDPTILNVNSTQNLIGFLPFFHIFGSGLSLAALLHGAKFIILRKFVPDQFLSIIQEHKVTTLFVVPPILLFLVKSPLVKNYDVSSITDIICGAAPVSKEVEDLVEKKLNVKRIRQLYGMTETCGGVTIMGSDQKKYGSAGTVIPNHVIKVSDPETGKTLPCNKIGELRFKGDGIMKGYLGNSKETEAAFDEENFLRSGDLGYYDEEGYFYIVDRLKEVIKYKGFQVSPAELENLLIRHPAVKDAGVVGRSDERAGEVPVAFVVKQNQNITEEEILAYVAENLSVQKHLYGGVKFIDEIPKNPSGKILRRKLKEIVN